MTRHALAQLERLAKRSNVELSVVSGRVRVAEGLDYWNGLGSRRKAQLPLRTRDALRWWRYVASPTIEHWSGTVDWVYCPAEYGARVRNARFAVTSHDVLQDANRGERRLAALKAIFDRADRVLSVSQYNTQQLVDRFPAVSERVRQVPNAAEDLYFDEPTPAELAEARADLGLAPDLPYLLSVASFQARKNLPKLVRACGRLQEVQTGELALVLVGGGSKPEQDAILEAVSSIDPRAVVRMPGYRQGKALRAIYKGSLALVFPSLCESFGIPAVEAMAQRTPVALANSTALPEVSGAAGWYFDPNDQDSIASTLRNLIDRDAERKAKAELGRTIAERYRWDRANDALVDALMNS